MPCIARNVGPTLSVLLLSLDRLRSDVTTAESVRPFDAIDRRIGASLRLRDGLSCGADVQHASAIGNDVPVLQDRGGVEDFDAFDRCGVVKPLDRSEEHTS